jgi:rhamnulokinase
MDPTTNYLAMDLGAESGRAILGTLEHGQLTLEEIYRFANGPVRLLDGLHWDVLRLWNEIKNSISLVENKRQAKISSMAVDTWGVDFALLDRPGALLGNPFHYRDSRTDGMLEEAFRRMPRAEIFDHTGIQILQINTVYQLLSMVVSKSPLLDIAQTLLTIPDLFNYWLSGQITNEFTNATTTQCFDPRQHSWSWPVLDRFGIPLHLFHPVTEPGTLIGTLLPEIAEELNVPEFPIILPACHDTGSAVVAVPAENKDFAWISSGTWSIMGAEDNHPSITPQMQAYNFTNEGGAFGTWRISKNIMGLWLLQECKRTWAQQGENLNYEAITRLAAEAKPFLSVIDPDDSSFLHPGNMPERIRAYCQRTGQVVPQVKGEIARVALESIALKYRWTLARLEEVLGTCLEPIHLIGGGTQNQLLNQFTADATRRKVVAGPVEATTIGNILMQAITLRDLASLDEARQVVRLSFTPKTYEPGPAEAWEKAYAYFSRIIQAN